MLSAAKKRYLFAIYELGQTGKPIRSKDIASSLKLKPPSVSKMLNALSEDDLIEKEFYGTVTFTQSGAAMANQLYMDYLTLFAFFHQALEIPKQKISWEKNLYSFMAKPKSGPPSKPEE